LAANTVTSAVTAANLIQFATGTMTAAQFLGMEAVPHLILAAQGANTLIRVHDFTLELVYGTMNLANGGAVGLEYGAGVALANTAASATQAAAGFTGAAASSVYGFAGALPAALAAATTVNTGIYISNTVAPFITGDSTYNWYLSYSVYATT
jgi:hypothetical protein